MLKVKVNVFFVARMLVLLLLMGLTYISSSDPQKQAL